MKNKVYYYYVFGTLAVVGLGIGIYYMGGQGNLFQGSLRGVATVARTAQNLPADSAESRQLRVLPSPAETPVSFSTVNQQEAPVVAGSSPSYATVNQSDIQSNQVNYSLNQSGTPSYQVANNTNQSNVAPGQGGGAASTGNVSAMQIQALEARIAQLETRLTAVEGTAKTMKDEITSNKKLLDGVRFGISEWIPKLNIYLANAFSKLFANDILFKNAVPAVKSIYYDMGDENKDHHELLLDDMIPTPGLQGYYYP